MPNKRQPDLEGALGTEPASKCLMVDPTEAACERLAAGGGACKHEPDPLGSRTPPSAAELPDLARKLGFTMPSPTSIAYSEDYQPPVRLSFGLAMVPHGQTPSNVKLLFQSHEDGGPNQTLTEKGVAMARSGAAAFAQQYAADLRERPDAWVFYRSPLSRTAATAAAYADALREAGVAVPEPAVDPALLEVNAGSWHGHTVEGLAAAGRQEDAEAAAQYRTGSFVARAVDGSGESLLEVIARAAAWLRELEARYGGSVKNVLVFGHGTFQNAVEVLLRCYPEKGPAQVFSRISGGSHLRRGEVHVLAPLV